jgi:hypothetical protein
VATNNHQLSKWAGLGFKRSDPGTLWVSKPQCLLRSPPLEADIDRGRFELGPCEKGSQWTCPLKPPVPTSQKEWPCQVQALCISMGIQNNSEKKSHIMSWLSQFLRPQLETQLRLSEAVSITTRARRTEKCTSHGKEIISCCWCCFFLIGMFCLFVVAAIDFTLLLFWFFNSSQPICSCWIFSSFYFIHYISDTNI